MIKKFTLFLLSMILALTMFPMTSFADESDDNSINIYGIYMKRNSGSAVSSDRYGDAVLVESNGEYLLMDTGAKCPIKNSDAEYPSNLVKTLKAIGVSSSSTFDVYISHVHGDHTGGLEAVCENFNVRYVYLPDTEIAKDYETPNAHKPISKIYSEKAKIARDNGATVVYLSPSHRTHWQDATDTFSVGSATCTVMGPVGNFKVNDFKSQDGICGSKEGHYLNNYSLTTMIQCGNFKFLTTGDSERQQEAKLVDKYGTKLNADLMKAGHHGLYTSNKSTLVKKVTPRWSFEENHGYYGSPVSASVSNLQDYGYTYAVATKKSNYIFEYNDGKVKLYRDTNNNGKKDEVPYIGWIKVKKNYQYYAKDGVAATGWQNINGKRYYMSSKSGFRFKGTHTIKGTKCKFSSAGVLLSPKKPARTVVKKVTALKGQKIKITWTRTARAQDYQIYRSKTKTGGYELIATVSKSRRSYTDKELTKGKRYYYKVRGERHFSGTVRRGTFSKAKSAVAK